MVFANASDGAAYSVQRGRKRGRRAWARLVVASILLAGALPALQAATPYPTRPIKLIVTAPTGGTIDFLARNMTPIMAKELGQSVVIDNKGGASGLLGADLVAKAQPDGYTVLLTDGAALAINQAAKVNMPFDAFRDLVPVGLVATTPSILVANPGFAASKLSELVALAAKEPGKIGFATPGVGTPHHLAGEMFSSAAGIQLNHIPYKGGGAMVTDVIGGQVPLLITGTLATLPHIKAGKLKPLAIGSPKRSSLLPDVPTFIESGYPGFESEVFFSLFVPATTPPEVSLALQKAMQVALADPDVKRKLEEQAMVVIGGNGEALNSYFKREMAKWSEVIKAAKITLE